MHYVDAGEIFPGHPVDAVCQLLHNAETGNAGGHDHENRQADGQHKTGSNGGQLPAFAQNFDDGPNGHDGRFDHHLKAHGDDHLNLGNIVGGTGNQTGNGKVGHFFLPNVHYMMEDLLTHDEAEAGSRPGGKIAANDGQQRTGCGAAQHFQAYVQNIRRLAGRFDQHGQFRHVVRKPQVKVDLSDDENQTDQRHQRLFAAHVFE